MRIRDWSSDVCSSDFTDVSLQKARTAAFFSGAQAGAELGANASADVRQFVGATRTFLNDPAALTGTIAFADRSGGNLSRPYFPDGEVGRPHGPLRSEEHTSELQSLMRISYAVFCLKKKK